MTRDLPQLRITPMTMAEKLQLIGEKCQQYYDGLIDIEEAYALVKQIVEMPEKEES